MDTPVVLPEDHDRTDRGRRRPRDAALALGGLRRDGDRIDQRGPPPAVGLRGDSTGHGLEDVPSSFAEERDVDAFLIPNPITSLGRILIPIRDQKFAEPIAEFVSTLEESTFIHTSLLHITEDDEAVENGERFLSDVKQTLVEAGFPSTGIDTEVVVSDDPSFAVSTAAKGYDLIIMGETQQTGYEPVFGKMYESVADQTDLPIIVIREQE